ncbi:zinc ribbon domain-containing protein [Helicobacter sp. MIT 14-3879]|uniref:zinc ribbon domain-containing protein n=1 Tax=Helicobacter sp. MIT 14-3879 TaxID=2040649 RepID=UPI000E1F30CB|nr:C4-type zinc ribbon domain-containing protein [Helicobacter sp. MIT 14-3879]RDU61518.1 hypothetical protein CQA44_08635 [Helicobacter sp. MIT 14-3879]
MSNNLQSHSSQNKNLQKLIEVNKFDWEVSKFNPLIDEKRAPIRKKEQEKSQYIKEKQELEQTIHEKQELLIKTEEELQTVTTESQKIREKLKESKSEKEIKNLSMEEDILREKILGFNNEISNIEAFIEQAKSKITTLDSHIEEANKEIAAIQEACSDEINAIKNSQDEVSVKRQQIALDMEPTVLRLYEKIRKWAGNTSVIPLYKDACGGCFIRLNEKNLIDIRKGYEIVHCPHCGRILYDKEIYDNTEIKDEKNKEQVLKESQPQA